MKINGAMVDWVCIMETAPVKAPVGFTHLCAFSE